MNRMITQRLAPLSMIFSCLAGLVFSQVVQGEALPPAQFEEVFTAGNDSFRIKAKKSFVTLATGYGEKIEYSVYRNGKFIHPEEPSGGTLIGCRQPFTTPNDTNPIQKLAASGISRGWWIVTGEKCGNRSMRLYVAILPPLQNEATYKTETYKSNIGIFTRKIPNGEGIEVWTSKYFDDCGAWTLSYPKFDILEGHGKLPGDPAEWPKYSNFPQQDSKNTSNIYPTDFIGRFLTGIANKDINLLKAALGAFNQPTSSSLSEECKPKFLSKTKQDLQKIIDAYQVLDQARIKDLTF